MAISEKITLLGKGLYKDIPDVLTLKSIPTASELDYVGGEDFQATMLNTIFPQAIEEKVDFKQLLEIDFHWICRCLRLINYGPYYTTNAVICTDCGQVSHGEYRVDLRTIDVKPLPEGFTNSIVLSKDEFIDFNEDIVLRLPTIQDMMNAAKDPMFKNKDGDTYQMLARLCYMIHSVGSHTKLTPIDAYKHITGKLSSADFIVLKTRASELTDYGLRAGGTTVCPKCGSKTAAYMALTDDRFFRPTLGDLRAWKSDRLAQGSNQSAVGNDESKQRMEIFPGIAPTKV